MSTVNVPPRQSKPEPAHPAPCCCPACLGLKCLERPRFFAGQLLTEADFNSEQDYLLAKNRLHNRYLHGAGVVCGLEVVCSDCDGWVTVLPGYAIDPCGNDIIVCEPAAFNVIEAIRECCGTARRRKRDCDPYRPPESDACKEGERNWCITIEYQERETRGQMPLRNPATCGCGGSACNCGGGSGCGCGGKNGKTSHQAKHGNGNCSCKAPKQPPQQPAQCEPTRIYEGFKLCVVEESKDCSDPERGRRGPLLDGLRRCAEMVRDFLAQFPPQTQAILQAILNGAQPSGTPAQILDACCRMRAALIALIQDHDFLVHCDLLRTIPPCSDEPASSSGAGGGGNAANIDAIKKMIAILEQIYLDCVCHVMLPPCSGDPCDDRLILACVTVKNGRVIRICNFACRKFAGSFPSIFYWLSIFPIFSQIAAQFRRICCDPAVVVTADPAGNFPSVMRASGYAAPQAISNNVDQILSGFTLESLTGLAGPGAISLPSLVGLSMEQVSETLRQSQIAFSERMVRNAAELPRPATPFANLFAAPGGRVTVYRMGAEVVGFGAHDLAQELTDTRAEMAALRAEVEQLKPKAR